MINTLAKTRDPLINVLSFNQKLALRISIISIVTAVILGGISWYLAFNRSEDLTKGLTIEAAQHLTDRNSPFTHSITIMDEEASQASTNLVKFGIFDLVQIYDANFKILGSYTDELNDSVNLYSKAKQAQEIGLRTTKQNFYNLPSGERVVVTLAPLYLNADQNNRIIGYLETVRVVPQWRETQILDEALEDAVMVVLAVLICGGILYPAITGLNKEKVLKADKLYKSNIQLMKSLGEAVAKRDAQTGIHNYRVTLIAIKLAEAVNITPEQMEPIIIGSLLHDIGKISIPDAILLKPGKLSPEEMEIIKTHVTQGESMIKGRTLLHDGYPIISAHHEKWDGTGYPRGLENTKIPLSARIFAVADVFDSLCSQRPYKEMMSYEEAIEIITSGSGTHFDPQIVKAFLGIAKLVHTEISSLNEEQIQAKLDPIIDSYLREQLS